MESIRFLNNSRVIASNLNSRLETPKPTRLVNVRVRLGVRRLGSKSFFGRKCDALVASRYSSHLTRTRNANVRSEIDSGSGTGGSTDSLRSMIEGVPHLSEWIPDIKSFTNPIVNNSAYARVEHYWVEEDEVVCKEVLTRIDHVGEGGYFRRAGPRQHIVFNPRDVRAAIVTCGGLCPGLNTVIRELVWGLWNQYGVREIMGIDGGYRGFYARNVIPLTPKFVEDIHKRGGTILGTSRGGHETSKIVNSIEDRGINQVYIIGGDGTQRGAMAIYEEIRRRGLMVAVAGIPKTIDNDLAVIDRSFGFDTAVEEAQRAINAAHVEAESVVNGVGLVKLMGRYCGYIAMYATLASRDVDCCLIPEVPFQLYGKGGLLEFMEKRLRENGHCVLVVAEGAGQELMAQTGANLGSDASGNKRLLDVGNWLSDHIQEHFRTNKKEVNLKYIDPTYMIRAIPANASDNVYCTLLAHSAIHGAMAGFSGFTVGPVNGRHAYIPIERVTEKNNEVVVTDRMYARLIASTNQPSFFNYNEMMAMKKQKMSLARDNPSSSERTRLMHAKRRVESGFGEAHFDTNGAGFDGHFLNSNGMAVFSNFEEDIGYAEEQYVYSGFSSNDDTDELPEEGEVFGSQRMFENADLLEDGAMHEVKSHAEPEGDHLSSSSTSTAPEYSQ